MEIINDLSFTDNIRRRYRHLRWGLWYGYPICCVLRFTFDKGLSGHKRGGKHLSNGAVFVPCGIFHHYDPDAPPERWNLIQMKVGLVRRFPYGLRKWRNHNAPRQMVQRIRSDP